MNSLNDLNSYGAETINFTDNRTPGPVFDRPIAWNQIVEINQNDTHEVPVGINIVDIVRPIEAAITYTINVGIDNNASVSWSVIPSGCVVTNPSTGVYVISGIQSVATWETVRNPNIIPDSSYTGVFDYTATITWNLTETKSWTVNLTINDIDILDTATEVYFDPGTYEAVLGNPEIIDNYSTTWSVTITPSSTDAISNIISAGSGGSTSFNATSKQFNVTGTKTEVNSHLNSLSVVTPSTSKSDFTLTYLAVNQTLGEGDTKIQQWNSLAYIGETRANETYTGGVENSISNGPQITDSDYDGSGTYTMTVTPTVTASVTSLSSQGKYYWPVVDTEIPGYSSGQLMTNSDLSYFTVGQSLVNQGQVLVYTRSGDSITLQQTLTPTGAGSLGGGARFGQMVWADSDFDTLAITAPDDEGTSSIPNDRGAVYMFTRTGTVWTQRQRIASNSNTLYFENAWLTPNGDNLIIRAINNGTRQIRIYTRSSNTWTLATTFSADTASNYYADPYEPGYIGAGIKISPDGLHIAVTDYGEASGTNTMAGAVYMYSYLAGSWQFVVKLTSSPTIRNSYFGNFVCFDDNTTFRAMYDSTPGVVGGYVTNTYTWNGSSWSYVSSSTTSTIPSDLGNFNIETTDGTLAAANKTVYQHSVSGWAQYSTLTSSSTSLTSAISADGNYILGLSATGQTVELFKKTANDPTVSTWNNSTKTLSIYGTRSFINSEIDTIKLNSAAGYTTDITLTYTVITPRSDTDSRTQLVAYTSP